MNKLQQRLTQERSGDYSLLRNSRALLAYEDRYAEAGFDSFLELFTYVSGRAAHTVTQEDLTRRLRPARSIAPEEAWESDLGQSALHVVARPAQAERAVFFACGRRAARARRSAAAEHPPLDSVAPGRHAILCRFSLGELRFSSSLWYEGADLAALSALAGGGAAALLPPAGAVRPAVDGAAAATARPASAAPTCPRPG